MLWHALAEAGRLLRRGLVSGLPFSAERSLRRRSREGGVLACGTGTVMSDRREFKPQASREAQREGNSARGFRPGPAQSAPEEEGKGKSMWKWPPPPFQAPRP